MGFQFGSQAPFFFKAPHGQRQKTTPFGGSTSNAAGKSPEVVCDRYRFPGIDPDFRSARRRRQCLRLQHEARVLGVSSGGDPGFLALGFESEQFAQIINLRRLKFFFFFPPPRLFAFLCFDSLYSRFDCDSGWSLPEGMLHPFWRCQHLSKVRDLIFTCPPNLLIEGVLVEV